MLARSNTKTFVIDLQSHQQVWSTPQGGEITIGEGAIYIAGISGQLTAIGFDAMPTPTGVVPSHTHYTAPPAQVTISGSGFSLGQNLTVRFDGTEASQVQVLDDQTLTCTVPPHGPGLVDVVVTNSIGQVQLHGGFAYTPAAHVTGSFHPGGNINLSCFQDVGETIFCAYGTDSISVPVPPFVGELGLWPPAILFVVPGWLQPRFDLTMPIPANPALTGAEIRFQTLVGSNVPGGVATFSNVSGVTIQ